MSSPTNWQKYQHEKRLVLRRNMRPFNYFTIGILSFKAPKRLPPCQVWTQLGHKKKILIFSKTLHRRQLMVLSLGKRELITDAPSAKQQPRNKALHSPSIPVNLYYLLRSHTFIGDLIFWLLGPTFYIFMLIPGTKYHQCRPCSVSPPVD